MTKLIPMTGFALLAALSAMLFSGCTPTPGSAASPPRTKAPIVALAGWYTQDAARATLQPCGEVETLVLANDAGLRERAQTFGLQDGDPVYVQIEGSREDGSFRLDRIDQFGSDTPVRDCAMTGTSIQH